MNNKETEILLWEYIDGACNEAERTRISGLIASEPVSQQKFRELSAFNTNISMNIEAGHPSLRFTKNVMDAVAGISIVPATKKYINKGIIRGIAAFFIIMLAILFGYAIGTGDFKAGTTGSLLKGNIDKASISNLLSGPIFYWIIYANIILTLVFADKLIRKERPQ